MKKTLFAFIILAYAGQIYSQEKTAVEYFPSDLTMQPFAAGTIEPKLGFLFKAGSTGLRLDIGNSLDIVKFSCGNKTYSAGADLFTWTSLRREVNFHFPVEAVDYLFGLNFNYKAVSEEGTFGVRTRLSHISAHFVDGNYDGTNRQWINGQNPRVYSREFVEITPYYEMNKLRFYGGFTYLFHVDPIAIKKDNYQIGFDYFADNYLGERISPYAGYDFKMIHLNQYRGNNSIVAGVKFGKARGRGISIYYQYYAGNNIHGEYYDSLIDYSAIGINLDL